MPFEEKVLSYGHAGLIRSVAFSPDGKLALSGSYESTVRLWDVKSGRALRVLDGHAYSLCSVAWGPDGALALSGAEDGVMRMWDVASTVKREATGRMSATGDGQKPVTQILFEGERFDVMSVRRWRKRALLEINQPEAYL